MAGLQYIQDAVQALMGDRFAGHDINHIWRVQALAGQFAQKIPQAQQDLVAAAALLHDCDDYKLFGEESAKLLTNTRRILAESGCAPDFCTQCIKIVQTIGYQKRLAGITPDSIEGAIVADADMCDALGVVGIVRCIEFGAQKKRPFFDPAILPLEGHAQSDKQDAANRTTLNHFFEKLLRLRDLCLTAPGKACAVQRHQVLVHFLQDYFAEVNAPSVWQELLIPYIS